jgi:hypothetical protein
MPIKIEFFSKAFNLFVSTKLVNVPTHNSVIINKSSPLSKEYPKKPIMFSFLHPFNRKISDNIPSTNEQLF